MKTTWKVFGVSVLVFLFFGLMSRIDFIVHSTLYNYGLQFSYQWANEYWIVYCVLFFNFSFLVGFMYWLGSNKNERDRKVSIALTVSMSLLALAGTADIMVFVLWVGRLPPENVMWWWAPWYHIFGVWTTFMQLVFTSIIFMVIAFMWVQILNVGTWIKQLLPTYKIVHDAVGTADQESTGFKND